VKLSVKVIGESQLLAKLRRLSDNVAGQALENAVVSGALLVQNEAKTKSPYLTGNLRRSIHIGGHSDKSELGNSTGDDIGGNKNTRDRAEVLVGTNVEYARRQEFGFSGADSRGRIFNQVPRPYLRPALDEKKQSVAKEIAAALKILLGKL